MFERHVHGTQVHHVEPDPAECVLWGAVERQVYPVKLLGVATYGRIRHEKARAQSANERSGSSKSWGQGWPRRRIQDALIVGLRATLGFMDSPRDPGRPSKATPALAKQIALLVLEGQPLRAAAEACGLDGASLFSYLAQAKAGDPAYQDFARVIESAKEQRRTWAKAPPGHASRW